MTTAAEALLLETFATSDRIKDGRQDEDIHRHATKELGELATEIDIENGTCYKEPGADGVVGEAVDVMLCMLDLIHQARPDLTAAEILEIARPKLAKWEATAKRLPITLRVEPGAYRDPRTKETLEDAWVARNSKGTVVGVSHDRAELQSRFWCTTVADEIA